jgi:hypothetical protein
MHNIKLLQTKNMIRYNDHKQQQLFDPWEFLGEKRRKLLDSSWAGIFQKEILPILPIRQLFPFFSATSGRPTKELYTVIGVLLFQQAFDLTDQETIEQMSFNIQWHYALNIYGQSDQATYMSPKTLWNNRDLVVQHGLDKLIFQAITGKLAEVFGVDTTKQRLDSVHIKSNMQKLGRIRIFSETIHRFLVNLKRNHPHYFASVDEEILNRFLLEKAIGCFSRVKPSESQKTLDMVSRDLYRLVVQFENTTEICNMNSYKLLARVLKEQCNVTENTAVPKVPKEISSDSLQNPSDPDATYSGHKGQGFQAQIMETYSEGRENPVLNLITHVAVEPSHNSDAYALIPAIEAVKEQEMMPEVVLADSLYGSDDNTEKAAAMAVEIVSPVMGGTKQGILQAFNLLKNGRIASCPQGHIPENTKKRKNRYGAAFNSLNCQNCPMKDNCPSKQGKKFHYIHYTDKDLRVSKRRAYEQTPEFKDKYRYRSGVESTMSQYDRRTGVKRLRVRGLKAVRYCATMKATAVNIFRAAVARAAQSRADRGKWHTYFFPNRISKIVKELFCFFKPNFCYELSVTTK